MARYEIDGIFKHAPLTEDQIGASQNRNLDREIVINTDFVDGDPFPANLGSDAGLVNYILSYTYDNGSEVVRRNIPSLELLSNTSNTGTTNDKAGADWVNVEAKSYNYISSGETVQTALEELDTAINGISGITHIKDGSTDGSLYSSPDGASGNDPSGSATYQVNLGNGNTLTNSASSSALGGVSNTITRVTRSAVVAGAANNIESTNVNYIGRSIIGAGTSNTIKYLGAVDIESGVSEIIGSGASNTIWIENLNAGYNGIMSGTSNIVYDSSYGFIGSGTQNKIYIDSEWGAVASGYRNEMAYSKYSIIGAGYDNRVGFYSSISTIARVGSTITVTLSTNVPDTIVAGATVRVSGTVNFNDEYTIATIGAHPTNTFTITDAGAAVSESTGYAAVGQIDYAAAVAGYNNYVHGYADALGGNSANNAVLTGNRNIVNGAMQSAIVSGSYNTVRYSVDSSIASGYINYIDDSSYSSIGSGYLNYISNETTYSMIAAGQSNYLGYNGSTDAASASTHNFIGAGNLNYMTEGVLRSAVVSGVSNYINVTVNDSFIGAGSTNSIEYTSGFCFIGAGTSNYIGVSSRSGIIAGTTNAIHADYAFIGTGNGNTIFAGADRSAIVTGSNHEIREIYGFIGGGSTNIISATSEYATIGGGGVNTVLGSYASILGGYTNTINDGDYATVIGGRSNTIETSTYSVIAGYNNYILGAIGSGILSGQANEIKDADSLGGYATIAGGYNNYIMVTNTGSILGAAYGSIPGGIEALARNYGEFCHASGGFSNARGSAQHSVFLLRRTVTGNNNPQTVYLYLDGTSKEVYVPNLTSMSLTAKVIASANSGALVETIDNYLWVASGVGTTVSLNSDITKATYARIGAWGSYGYNIIAANLQVADSANDNYISVYFTTGSIPNGIVSNIVCMLDVAQVALAS